MVHSLSLIFLILFIIAFIGSFMKVNRGKLPKNFRKQVLILATISWCIFFVSGFTNDSDNDKNVSNTQVASEPTNKPKDTQKAEEVSNELISKAAGIAKEEEAKKKTEEAKKPEFISAQGMLYSGVKLYVKENGKMVHTFTIVDIKDNVKNSDGYIIKNAILVRDPETGETYWKDRRKMLEYGEQYGREYFVKSDDPAIPKF